MKNRIDSKNVMLITGTRKGIGKEIAEYYLEKGFYVVGCSRGESSINHENYNHFVTSVSDEQKAKLIFKFIKSKYNRLDFLINNAGIASMNHSLLTPIKTVKNILDTNVIGCFLFSREAVKLMQMHRFGRIVNFATFAIPFKLEGEAVYAASKAAVVSLTEILSREYSKFNITVNAVAPPAIKTDLIKGVPSDKLLKLLDRQSVQRFGEPVEVCKVIDFFIDKENEMINGQTIYMGGL
jgi:3-oxoacyl-[acyl-carrier protein] reductase